ncbi:MAG TPA: alkaline phosphatase family protein [Solirubrobacteraceae bacterium]
MRTFADIPAEIRRRVEGGERVILIFLDALGLEFLARHRDHPLVQRLEVTPLSSQFPSTTTAHVPTVHFGVPVQEHGLYEWNVLEPSLDEIICPLRFNAAGSDIDGELTSRLDPAALIPGPTLYESLAARCVVLQPDRIAGSVFTRIATRGATTRPFRDLEEGAQALAGAFGRSGTHGYGFLYWDLIDRAGHEQGPSSPQFDAAARSALNALWNQLRGLRDVTVLVTADHGQVDVSPARVDYLDELWPQLPALLSQPRPAGSSRDAFLHVREGHLETVIEELSTRLGERAEVRPAAELFHRPGARLRARLGDVAVLAAPGRQVWLRSAAANERWFRGQHGGRESVETSTYLAQLTS